MTTYTTTLNAIRAASPCKDGWGKLLSYLGKTKADDEPLELLTILDSNGLDDALWVLSHAMRNDEASPDERAAAWDAAEAAYAEAEAAAEAAARAARDATRDAAWYAPRDAARAAAWDAATWAEAEAAARAARDATRAATRAAQEQQLRKMLTEGF